MRVTSLIILLYIATTLVLYANDNIGCTTAKISETSCSESNPFEKSSFELTALFSEIPTADETNKTKTETIHISPKIDTIVLTYQNKEFRIQRKPHTKKQSCPPYCIQPMRIENVETVGELETLMFMQSLSDKTSSLLIDARTPSLYKLETLPAAINIPYTLLHTQSKHKSTILELLGAKKVKGKWRFQNVRKLLIFDSALWDFQAVMLIRELIKVGYPQDHLKYYRGGLRSWKEAGLSHSTQFE